MTKAATKTHKAIVTWLECTELPRQLPALPVNLHASLMRVNNIPLHFYRYLQWRTGRRWHWVHRLRMKDEELAKQVHDPSTEIRILNIDGAPAGFFELKREDADTTNLVYFGLIDNAIGRGVGKWLLGQAQLAAWNQPISRLTVSTNTLDHPAALPLYQKMGFRPVSQNEALVRPLTDDELLSLMKAE